MSHSIINVRFRTEQRGKCKISAGPTKFRWLMSIINFELFLKIINFRWPSRWHLFVKCKCFDFPGNYSIVGDEETLSRQFNLDVPATSWSSPRHRGRREESGHSRDNKWKYHSLHPSTLHYGAQIMFRKNSNWSNFLSRYWCLSIEYQNIDVDIFLCFDLSPDK